jgi:hypothetical protein
MALGDIIARLAVHLDLDSASFETGAKKAATTTDKMHAKMSKAAKGIGVALAGMVTLEGINQLRDMHRAALDSAGGLGEQAKALGVSTTALQEFRFAATQTGLSTEQMDNALGQFSKRLGEAMVTGKGKFIQGLEQIGLSLEDLKGKTESEQIALIADGINKLGTEAEKSAAQVAFFGKSGQAMATLLGEGSKGIKAFADEAERAGIILSEGDIAKADETADKLAKLDYVLQARLNKSMLQHSEAVTKAEVAWGEFKITALAAIGETVAKVEAMANSPWPQKFSAGFTLAIQSFVPFSTAAVNMGNAVGEAIRNMVINIGSWIGDKLGAIWDGAIAKVEQVRNAFFNLWDKVTRRSYVPDMVADIAREIAKLDTIMVKPAEEVTVRVAKSFKDMAEETMRTISNLASAIKSGGFLGILEAVVGVGLQLGGIGLFGKKIATNINSSRGYASGTMSASRGLAMVGERGPELVRFNGGERVFNNRDSRRMMGGGVMEIRPSPLFEVYVDGKLVEAAPMMISAAANAGAAKMQRMEGRRLA